MPQLNVNIEAWLMEADPSICFQVKRDLLHLPKKEWEKEQKKIEKTGWGKRLLELQDEKGYWSRALYSPKWISTHYTLMLLLRLGLPPENFQAQKGSQLLLEKGFYVDGGINFFGSLKHSETCVTGMVLSLCSYFQLEDSRIDDLFEFLLKEQMKDGGWNCQSFNGATHSSMHTTISVLEGLYYYGQRNPVEYSSIRKELERANEFLLIHKLFKSHRTGKVINPAMTRMPFPPRWRYDIIRVLDYFRLAGFSTDERMGDAIALIERKEKNGKWPLQANYPGKVYFNLEEVGKESRMNTLRAMRILNWWKK